MQIKLVTKSGQELRLKDAPPARLPALLRAQQPFLAILDEEGGWLHYEDDQGIALEGTLNISPRGRLPIGVNQPPFGGSVYPFVTPSADIRRLLGDFYLSYPDDHCQFTLPFKLDWLYGFGAITNDNLPGFPAPAHSQDLRVVDAHGQPVFDSTTASGFQVQSWAGRMTIYQWLGRQAVCRCTQYTTWSVADLLAGTIQDWTMYLFPPDGTLDPRTVDRLPLRVTSLRVGLVKFSGSKVQLAAGTNIALAVTTAGSDNDYSEIQQAMQTDFAAVNTKVAGQRVTQQLSLDAVAGAGTGVVPGCTAADAGIYNLGGVTPDPTGNITIDLSGCLRLQRPTVINNDQPREFEYLAAGLTADQAATALVLHNDCLAPCCSCDMYVRTYKGLRRQWQLWQGLTIMGEAIRDVYGRNVARWLAQKSCREGNPLQSLLLPEPGCKVATGASFCNGSPVCLLNVEIRLSFVALNSNNEPLQAADCGTTTINDQPAALAGNWPVYSAILPFVSPQESGKTVARLCLAGCQDSYMQLYITVHYADPAVAGWTPPIVSVPAPLQTIWDAAPFVDVAAPVRALLATTFVPLNATNPYCAGCQC